MANTSAGRPWHPPIRAHAHDKAGAELLRLYDAKHEDYSQVPAWLDEARQQTLDTYVRGYEADLREVARRAALYVGVAHRIPDSNEALNVLADGAVRDFLAERGGGE